MFYRPNFITTKIFAFLNASIDCSEKSRCYRNNFNLMRLQYSLFVSVRHNGNLCKNVIFSCRQNCVDNCEFKIVFNKGLVH